MRISALYEALTIFNVEQGNNSVAVTDDQIWCGEWKPELYSEVELTRLNKLGWFEDEGSWSAFI